MSILSYIAVAASNLILARSFAALPASGAPVQLAPQDHAPKAALRRVSAAAVEEQATETIAIDLPTIKTYIDKVNDTCDKVNEVLDLTNVTMAKMMEQLEPAVNGALGMLDKAKIASEAADTFGMSSMGDFVTNFADKMSVKVVDFQTKLTVASEQMQDDLEKVRVKFEDIRVKVVDKLGNAFQAVSSLVEMVVGIVEATKAAVEASGRTEEDLAMMRRTAAKDLPHEEASIKKTELAAAHTMIRSASVSAMKYGLNVKTLEQTKVAIEDARFVLEPLADALVELDSKLQHGMLGEVLDSVQTGVDELNQTAFDAVQTASAALPGIIKNQMQGMFTGLLSQVNGVAEQIEDAIAMILSKLEEANNTKAELGQAVTMMDDLVDGVEPIFEESFAARLASTGCALFLVAGITLGLNLDF